MFGDSHIASWTNSFKHRCGKSTLCESFGVSDNCLRTLAVSYNTVVGEVLLFWVNSITAKLHIVPKSNLYTRNMFKSPRIDTDNQHLLRKHWSLNIHS